MGRIRRGEEENYTNQYYSSLPIFIIYLPLLIPITTILYDHTNQRQMYREGHEHLAG